MIDYSKKISEMNIQELDNLIFYKVRKANDQQFKGIASFLYQLLEENRDIINELDHIKAYIRSNAKGDE